MTFLLLCTVVTVLVWFYIAIGHQLMHRYFPVGWDAFERKVSWLWQFSRTILAARLYWIGGLIIFVHDAMAQAGYDWTPLLTQLTNLLPEQYRGLAFAGAIMLTGVCFELLRHATTESLDEKKQP